MRVAICLDDDFGMTFGGRRQSRDKEVCLRAAALAEGGKLYVTSFSEKLFAEYGAVVDDNMLEAAGEGDLCFLENACPPENARELIAFRWNRRYPGDMHFVPAENGYTLVSSEDFAGNSHERITMEIYRK